ncbi:MAG: RIP metalloprotease RseP [Selenomonadales bacterium]|nr:RIP metalloprotease RseP [Selenomonadales bacterium]
MTIIATIFVFGILVFVHELGHFLTAKAVGMRVEEFALGFGKKIVGVQKGETLYSLRMIPLGGFNKISGMDPEEEQDERGYSSKPVWARMIVIVAGSFMNFILPILLFFIVLMSSGVNTASNEPVLGELIDGKPAVVAGLAEGDRIVEINGVKIKDWHGVVDTLKAADQPEVMITYIRDGVQSETVVTAEWEPGTKRYLIGVLPKIDHRYLEADEALITAVKQTGDIIQRMLAGLGQMVTGQTKAELAGPLGVVQMTGEVASLGFIPLLKFMAFLSINLGIINLLPIPALDGGHFVTLVVEGIRGKAISSKKIHAIQLIGFVLLIGLMIYATISDITRFNF